MTLISARNESDDSFTCCMDDLSKDSYPYDSPSNHEACDSITPP